MTVRTRIAPSPTGYLHIGGVRTALYNWLFARKHGGQFILRIDDTDAKRNVEEALQPILDGFRWLGIDWDEGPECGGPHGPYYQSQRNDHYQAAVDKLLDSGAAYADYSRPAEVQAEREAAEKAKQSFNYSRNWMAETPEQAAAFEAEGRERTVRMKTPREGSCQFDDHVRGPMNVKWVDVQDTVIQRADGSFLYHLATVVDDADFEISHVIRAEEHLSNTPRQILIAQGLGVKLPEYAHLPVVAEPGSKKKLSKRDIEKYLKHRDFKRLFEQGAAIGQAMGLEINPKDFNPVLVDFYRQTGYLPDAVVNYLLLLGWSLDDHTEDFTREEMISGFSLERVNKSAASFDPQKMQAVQERFFARLPVKQKVAMVLPYLQRAGFIATPPPCDTAPHLTQLVEAAGDRLKVAGDILNHTCFFVEDAELEYEPKAFEKRLKKPAEAVELLTKFRGQLAAVEPFTAEALDAALHQFVEAESIKIGQIIHALRVAVSGSGVGFGMFETLAVLGRQSCLNRIDRAISLVQ